MTFANLSLAVRPLDVLLIVLVAAAVWAVVELALTIRKARSSVDDLTRSANETIEQVQPIITKLDGAVDDLQPSIKQIGPIVDRAKDAVDVATVDLARVNDILSDVSEVSGTAANVTGVVNKVADSATAGVTNVIGRITGRPKAAAKGHLEEGARAGAAAQAQEVPAAESEPAGQSGYVTYGGAGEAADGQTKAD